MTPIPVEELLPHRSPMILLDAMTAFDSCGATCNVVVKAGAPFVEGECVSSAVFIEYMAQTIAAYAGNIARTEGKAIQPGYLLGTRLLDLRVHEARLGDMLVVRVEKLWGNELLGSFRCEIHHNGTLLADGVLSVYQGPLPEEMP